MFAIRSILAHVAKITNNSTGSDVILVSKLKSQFHFVSFLKLVYDIHVEHSYTTLYTSYMIIT